MAAHHPLLERTNVALALNASFETNGSSGRFGVVSGYCITRRPREGGGRWRLIPAPLRKTTAAPAFAGATAVIGRNPPFSPVAANPLLPPRCDLLAPFAAVADAVMAARSDERRVGEGWVGPGR